MMNKKKGDENSFNIQLKEENHRVSVHKYEVNRPSKETSHIFDNLVHSIFFFFQFPIQYFIIKYY